MRLFLPGPEREIVIRLVITVYYQFIKRAFILETTRMILLMALNTNLHFPRRFTSI